MVHYTGFITIPANNTIQFMVAADDGGTVKIGLEEFGTWNDKGCSWSAQTTFALSAGVYNLDGWFYEHGGGTCYMLAWRINLGQWEIVPDSAFTTNNVVATTTTTTTTTEPATTTVVDTTTSVVSTTTSSTTTLAQQTTTTTSTILEVSTTQTTQANTTTTTTIPETTTTSQPYTPPQTSTTVTIPETTTTTTTSTTTTTTTSLPEPTTTTTTEQAPVQTTQPETTTTKVAPIATVSTVSNETTTPSLLPPTTTSSVLETILEPVILPEIVKDQPISQKEFTEILDKIQDIPAEKLVAVIATILDTPITQQQAIQLVATPQVLEAVTEQQAEQIFTEIAPEQLSETEAEAIIEAVQNAPTKVKKAFEKIINIFGSQFENYVAVGSNIPVSQRRTLVAVGGLLTMLPTPPSRKTK